MIDTARSQGTCQLLRQDASRTLHAGWAVVTNHGTLLADGFSSRAEAIRGLGGLARDIDALPLWVVDEMGQRTGDRLG